MFCKIFYGYVTIMMLACLALNSFGSLWGHHNGAAKFIFMAILPGSETNYHVATSCV